MNSGHTTFISCDRRDRVPHITSGGTDNLKSHAVDKLANQVRCGPTRPHRSRKFTYRAARVAVSPLRLATVLLRPAKCVLLEPATERQVRTGRDCLDLTELVEDDSSITTPSRYVGADDGGHVGSDNGEELRRKRLPVCRHATEKASKRPKTTGASVSIVIIKRFLRAWRRPPALPEPPTVATITPTRVRSKSSFWHL